MDATFWVALAVLAALLIVAAVVGLRWLRSQWPEMFRRRGEALARARQLTKDFSNLARRQPVIPAEPYATRLEQAGKGIRAGWERARRCEAQLRADQPEPVFYTNRQLALLLPLAHELGLRLVEETELVWWERQLERAGKELEQARQRLADIEGLGKQEQSTLERVRQETHQYHQKLSEHPLAPALAAELDNLSKLASDLDEANAKLENGEPSPAQVVEVYPVRVQAEKSLGAIRQAAQGHEANSARLKPRVERAREHLDAFDKALSSEEARRPAPKLRERTSAAQKTLEGLENSLKHGEYAAIEPGLAALATQQKELEDTLKKLAALRTRLNAAQEQVGTTLTGLQQWLKQYPPPYMMDTSEEQLAGLQARLKEQVQAAVSEEPAELEAACQVSLEEIRKTQASYERSFEIYQRVAPRLTPEAVDGLQKRGEHLAARLKLRHSSYQEKAKLALLEEHLGKLAESWPFIQKSDPNRESDLIKLGSALVQVEATWGELERDNQRVFETLEQVKAQQERATLRLEDEVFNEVAALAQLAGTEWGALSQRLIELRQPLLERANKGGEDFTAVQADAETLFKDASRITRDFQFRLARAQTDVKQLVDTLNGLADRLDRLEQHPYLDFGERAGAPLDQARLWLGQAQTPAASGFERLSTLSEQGAQLAQLAEAACRAMEAETAAADQDRAWTEDMLATAEEFLGQARAQRLNAYSGELASAHNLLETARRKMELLAAPRRHYTLDEYKVELADVRQMITGARDHIDAAAG
jgi:hypothetical protein